MFCCCCFGGVITLNNTSKLKIALCVINGIFFLNAIILISTMSSSSTINNIVSNCENDIASKEKNYHKTEVTLNLILLVVTIINIIITVVSIVKLNDNNFFIIVQKLSIVNLVTNLITFIISIIKCYYVVKSFSSSSLLSECVVYEDENTNVTVISSSQKFFSFSFLFFSFVSLVANLYFLFGGGIVMIFNETYNERNNGVDNINNNQHDNFESNINTIGDQIFLNQNNQNNEQNGNNNEILNLNKILLELEEKRKFLKETKNSKLAQLKQLKNNSPSNNEIDQLITNYKKKIIEKKRLEEELKIKKTQKMDNKNEQQLNEIKKLKNEKQNEINKIKNNGNKTQQLLLNWILIHDEVIELTKKLKQSKQ